MGRGAPGKASSRVSHPLAARQRLVLGLWVPSPRPVLDWGEGVCSRGGRTLLLLSAFLVGRYFLIYSIVLPGKQLLVYVCALVRTHGNTCVYVRACWAGQNRRRVAASLSASGDTTHCYSVCVPLGRPQLSRAPLLESLLPRSACR